MASPIRAIKIRFTGDAKGAIKAGKETERAIDGVKRKAEKVVATSAAGGMLDALGALPSQLKGAAIVAAVGLGAVMAPSLASALISGVLLAVGGGVLAAGIIGAAKDSRVANAWKKFGNQASKTFTKFSQPFIKPLVRAADTFRKALKRAEPTILRLGRIVGPIIDKLAPAIAAIAERALPGIARAVEASMPFLEAFLDPRWGDAIGSFFDSMAKGAPNALVFFRRFVGFLQDAVSGTGKLLTWLSDFGAKAEALWKGPEFTGLREALKSFKDHVLAGVKSAFEDIGKAIQDNSAKWKEIKDNVAEFIAFAGPGFEKLVAFLGQSTANGIILLSELALWISRVIEGLTKIDDLYRRLTGKDKFIKVDREGKSGNGGFQGFASGGRGSGWVMTGERGRELVDLGNGGRVYNNQETEQMLAGGGGTTVIENHIHIGDEVVRVVKSVVREANRSLKRGVLAGAGAS